VNRFSIFSFNGQFKCLTLLALCRWTGRYVWGVSYEGLNCIGVGCTLPDAASDSALVGRPLVTLSTSEKNEILLKLQSNFDVVYSAGAGYKLLCTVDRLVDAYVLSNGSTFKWDTCAPHAILLAIGGGIIDLKNAVDAVRQGKETYDEILQKFQLKYHLQNPSCDSDSINSWANSNGIVAYSDRAKIFDILRCLAS